MRPDWVVRRLGEIADVGAGNSAPQDEKLFLNGKHPFFRTADAGRVRFGDIYESSDHLNEKGIEKLKRYPIGTILFPKSGASTFLNHRVALGVEGYVTSHLATIVANPALVKWRYLLYFLATVSAQDLVADKGYPSLNLPSVAGIDVPIPPLPEQKRIVGILDEAFVGIAKARTNAENNLANAKELFESYLAGIFTDEAREGGLPVGDVAEIFDGPHATPKTIDEGPIFLGIGALEDGEVNLSETRHVSRADFKIWTRRVKPRHGDVVFSYETRLGQAALIPEGLECCLGRRMGLIRPKDDKLDGTFLVYQYISPTFRKFLDSKTMRGATVDRISVRDFPSFKIFVPEMGVQKTIGQNIKVMTGQVDELRRLYRVKVEALDALRSSILDRAFSGNL